jgi:hypothetical protein
MELNTNSLREVAITGQAFAELFAPNILAADEGRRQEMIESACNHVRKSITIVTDALKVAGATDFQIREIHIVAEMAFSDRLAELLHPTTNHHQGV